jgi:hypothetical protein
MYDVQVYITNTYNIEEKWTQVREKTTCKSIFFL